jgi:hypothetical protein
MGELSHLPKVLVEVWKGTNAIAPVDEIHRAHAKVVLRSHVLAGVTIRSSSSKCLLFLVNVTFIFLLGGLVDVFLYLTIKLIIYESVALVCLTARSTALSISLCEGGAPLIVDAGDVQQVRLDIPEGVVKHKLSTTEVFSILRGIAQEIVKDTLLSLRTNVVWLAVSVTLKEADVLEMIILRQTSLVLLKQRHATAYFTITALLIEVGVLIFWSKIDADEGTGGVLKREIQQVMANLLSGVVPVSNKLVYHLRHQGLQRPLLVNKGDKSASKVAIRGRLFLSLGGVLDNVLNDRVRICARRDVSVCLPRHRHKAVVFVDKAVVARRIVPKPLTTRCWVLVEFGLVSDLV